jgi:hypothetical protein
MVSKVDIGSQFHNGMQSKDASFSSQQGEGEGALGWDYDKLLSWEHGHVKLHTHKKKADSVVCNQIGAWVVHKSFTQDPPQHRLGEEFKIYFLWYNLQFPMKITSNDILS